MLLNIRRRSPAPLAQEPAQRRESPSSKRPRRVPASASRAPALGSYFSGVPAGTGPGVPPPGVGSHRRARVPGTQKSPAQQALSRNPSAATAGDLTTPVMKARNPATTPFQINGLARAGRYFGRPSAAAKVSAYSRETPPKRPPANGARRLVNPRRSNHKHLDRIAPRKPGPRPDKPSRA
jgi:hypothetical protein